MNLRYSHPLLAHTNLRTVTWEGPQQQARSVSLAKDLIAGNIPISIKADSNVVANLSPHVLFVSIPTGSPSFSSSENWFLQTAPRHYQRLYDFIRSRGGEEYPTQVAEYESKVPKRERRPFRKLISDLSESEAREFNARYVELCREVSAKSAEMLTRALNVSLKGRGHIHIEETIVRNLLRLGDSHYVLCGLDGGNEFAVTVPDITVWKREWRFKGLQAAPDLSKRQSVVDLELVIAESQSGREHRLPFQVQIRWSHGKFGTNPEAKVYKKFKWSELPFASEIIKTSPVTKLSVLGTGGFGIVYSGHIKRTGTPVAIKELSLRDLSNTSDQMEARKRFEREVNIQSSLQHPGIIPIIDSDLSAETPWFAAPIARCSVADILSELSGDPARRNSVFRQVLEAMEYAHSQSVIHRDLKPANILLFDEDRVMVGDFGLGKHLDPSISAELLTQTSNDARGTYPYVAPEQLESFRDADKRSDIYALGVTLLAMILGREPSSLQRLDRIDNRYRTVIRKCCEQNPDDRFPSVRELASAFSDIE